MSVADIRKAITARQAEIERYESEASIHAAVIAGLPTSLPDEWPDSLAVFRTANRTQLVTSGLSADDRDLVEDLLQRDASRGALLEIGHELKKCRRLLAGLQSQLAPEQQAGPSNKAEAALLHLESLRTSGEIASYAIDEKTLQDFGSVGTVAVVMTRPDGTTKRRVVMVTDSGVTLIHSAN